MNHLILLRNVFIPFTFIFSAGCTKSNVSTSPTPIQTSIPTPPSAPTLTVTQSATSVLYNGSVTINFSTDVNSIVTVNNTTDVSSPITLVNLIKDTTLNFSSITTDPTSKLKSPATTKSVSIHVYSQRQTAMIVNSASNFNNPWILTSYSYEQYPLKGAPIVTSPFEKIIFYMADSCHLYFDNPTDYISVSWKLSNSDNTYALDDNIYHIVQLDDANFIIERTVKVINHPTDSIYVVKKYQRSK